MPHRMLLDGGGINWCWYHHVEADGNRLRVVEEYRLHKGRDAEEIKKHQKPEGYLETINPSENYRKQIVEEIGEGEGDIVRVKFYDGTVRYYYLSR